MSNKRALTDQELFEAFQQGLSDIDYLSSDDDDGWDCDPKAAVQEADEKEPFESVLEPIQDQSEEDEGEEAVEEPVFSNMPSKSGQNCFLLYHT
ncbi:hypothetical protein NQ314_001252 [Rhamnusium bicolor]|uniref:Uncharacterized protein n=1 Tax=Rhamnusium bicolor TaxID=1586634 RepID=A0AAV8ZT07_9CUCU|nr:hypothetical protein NQ314_001252 [Rhamnusium bicolor]